MILTPEQVQQDALTELKKRLQSAEITCAPEALEQCAAMISEVALHFGNEIKKRDEETIAVMCGIKPLFDALGMTDSDTISADDAVKIARRKEKIIATPALKAKVEARAALLQRDYPHLGATFETVLEEEATSEVMSDKLSFSGIVSDLAKQAMNAPKIIREFKKMKDILFYFDIWQHRYGAEIQKRMDAQLFSNVK